MKALGLLELNAVFLVAGLTLKFALTGWETRRAFATDLGFSYMLGVASVGVAATLVLIAGFGLSYASILLTAGAIVVASAGFAVLRGRPLPRTRGEFDLHPRTIGDYVGLACAALTLLLALSVLRAFHNQPLIAWDAWNFWIPKARAIYYFGGLDEQLFRTLDAPSYPLFVPALDAMVFRFTHSTDETTLAVQNWFLFVGFLGAAAAILGRTTRKVLIWIFILVASLIPEVEHRWFQLMADWTLDAFFVLAALLVLRWVVTRERWVIVAALIPFAAMLATKREGQLLAACLVVGAAAATLKDWRRAWPPLLAIAIAAYAVNVPWRLWWTSRGLTADTPDSGLGHLAAHLDRVLPSLRIVLEISFDYHLWLLAVPLAAVAALGALTTPTGRRPAIFFLATAVAVILGFTWILWSDPLVPLTTVPAQTPIPRAAGSLAFLSVALAPMLTTALVDGAPLPALEMPRTELLGSLRRMLARLESVSPARVLAALVGLAWLTVLATALVVRHSGWIYYQGGDQLWYYTLGWLLGHGQLTQTQVGYGWSVILAPISRFAGPDLVAALPAIVLLNTLVLLPAALAALYGIAARIGGRLFGYWAVLLWIALPFIGVLYTNAGYHQRYTELLLPQAFGLTAMADFPAMVAVVVSIYFCVRGIYEPRPQLLDGLAAGVAAGAAIAIKPSTALFLAGPLLALAYARRFEIAGVMLAGLAPAVVTLTVWKARGLGNVPLLSHDSPRPSGGLAAVAGLNFARYTDQLHWDRFTNNLDLIREHFWSGRLIQWLLIAGLIGLARASRPAAVLVGGWFFLFAIVKASYQSASFEDGSLLRILMPTYPAFVLLVASLPLLLPHVPAKLRAWRAGLAEPLPLTRLLLIAAAVLASAVLPLAAFGAARTQGGLDPALLNATGMPVPVNVDLGVSAAVRGRRVVLRWRDADPLGGPVFYRIWRDRKDGFTCPPVSGARLCKLAMPEIGTTHGNTFVDRPEPGRWVYRIALAANWLDDATYGDPYLVSRPLVVSVR
jgi:hypothetical protein